MFSLSTALLMVTALFNVTLSFFILRKNWRNIVNLFFGMYLLSLSGWALVLIGYQIAILSENAIFYGKAAYGFALLIGLSFYFFSFSFPDNKKPSMKMAVAICIFPLLYIVALLFEQEFLIEKITIYNGEKVVVENIFDYCFFAIIFSSLYVSGLVRILKKYLQSQGTPKIQLLMIGLSTAITGAGGMYYNLFLASPFIGKFEYLWSGPLFATSVSAIIMYSVFRFRLFNAKVIVTELLISLLWAFTLLRALLATNQTERVFSGGLFILALIIGSLLTRSVKAEVRSREQMETLADDLKKINADLRERTKQLEESQKKELAKTQEVLRLKDEFVFLAAHELRTPVTAIRGFLELTEDAGKKFPKDIQENLDAISEASSYLNQLINDLLEIARSEGGKLAVKITTNDFKPILKEVLNEVSSLVEEKGATINTNLGEPSLVECDPIKLKEVLMNLVSNAIKYNRENGIINISAYRSPDEKFFIFEIQDDGYGIPKEMQPRIFQKFFRANTKGTQEVLGTGLGLFITKMLVEKMGGSISFSSVEQKGTTFTFSVPLSMFLKKEIKISNKK